MRLINPIGRNKMATVADYIEPRGCACSRDPVTGEYLTADMRFAGGGPDGERCYCQCSFGTENRDANFLLGYNSDW